MTLTAPTEAPRQAELPDTVVAAVREVLVASTSTSTSTSAYASASTSTSPSTSASTPTPALASALVDSAFVGALDALAEVSVSLEALRSIDDDALIVATRRAAAERQLVDTHAALIAGEVARRSQPVLGSAGLAQRLGYRTTEELVRTTTGSTTRDAFAAVRVGRILSDTQSEGNVDPVTGVIHEMSEPWLAPVAVALLANELSVSAAESIRNGLGRPSDTITVEQLRDAAQQLCIVGKMTSSTGGQALSVSGTDADRLYRRARELREELDLDAAAVHEEARRSQRSLTLRRQPDGMTRLVWLMDPETAAIGTELYDRLTSPRGGGPRFVEMGAADQRSSDQRSSDQRSSDQRSSDQHSGVQLDLDPRSTAQLASDVFLELLRQGAEADSSQLVGGGAPVIRVLVTLATLRARRGTGHIEGQTEAVSINTVERLACAGSATEIVFDDAFQPLNVGREQRMFARPQRIALAARDGGCRFGNCERPPSWCEAHHVAHWDRDHGGTDIANGILLCRHHHLLLHNNGWEIKRDGADYSLIPPATVDPAQQAKPMPSKSSAYRELQRT
jgi:hypothetical protein